MTYLRKYLTRGRHHQRKNTSYAKWGVVGITILVLGSLVTTATTGSANDQEVASNAAPLERVEYLHKRTVEQQRAERRVRPRTVGKVAPSNVIPKAAPSPTVSPSSPSPKVTTKPPSPKPTVRGWVKPVRRYSFTSGYGSRWGTLHAGVDLAAPTGTPVYAAYSGTISLARWYGGYGYAVKIKHGNGYTTLYGHNSRLLVKAGQRVTSGQKIALMGSTGDSTGPHLHFETHVNGNPVNPVTFMAKRGVSLR